MNEFIDKIFDKIMWVVITATWIWFVIDVTIQYAARVI